MIVISFELFGKNVATVLLMHISIAMLYMTLWKLELGSMSAQHLVLVK